MTMETTGQFMQTTEFSSEAGVQERFICLSCEERTSFAVALEELWTGYREILAEYGLSSQTQLFCRIYISDMANQKDQLVHSEIFRAICEGTFSIIEQSPLGGGLISLLAYHAKQMNSPFARVKCFDKGEFANGWSYKGENYTMLCTGCCDGGEGVFDSAQQTKILWDDYTGLLDRQGISLLNEGVRTWIYVRDIDNHYAGMVSARKEFFKNLGLTPETRYLASTGIEGRGRTPSTLVTMDSLAIGGLQPGQIVRMEALEYLSPTILYGVTFERGLRVRFGDRSHMYISGTASIDRFGNVTHSGDVHNQTERTIENIEALLRNQNATLSDLKYILVYLRDPLAFDTVAAVVDRLIPPHVARLYLHGPVCRPSWLIEIEGVAVVADSNEFAPFF